MTDVGKITPPTVPTLSIVVPTCQTWLELHQGPCGKRATFYIKGILGYLWSGWHCDIHALDVARSMGHQGGSVLVPLNKEGKVLISE
jgi:hypothetical protein